MLVSVAIDDDFTIVNLSHKKCDTFISFINYIMNSFIKTMVSGFITKQLLDYAQSKGINPSLAQKVVAFAVPLIIAKLAGNTAEAWGSESLLNALSKHGNEVDTPVDQIDTTDGMKILGHIFGDKLGGFEKNIANTTDASPDLVQDMLGKIAPMVLGQLSKTTTSEWLDARGLSDLLQTAKQEEDTETWGMLDGILASALDTDGDGKLDAKDALNHGMNIFQKWMNE